MVAVWLARATAMHQMDVISAARVMSTRRVAKTLRQRDAPAISEFLGIAYLVGLSMGVILCCVKLLIITTATGTLEDPI
jgi:hypothetical protein